MSGGKSAAPQVNGSKGSAPNKSLPRTTDHRFVRDHFLSRAAQIYEKIRIKLYYFKKPVLLLRYSLMSGGNVVGGGGGQPLLAAVGISGGTGEKGTMSKMSVDCGLVETLPACVQSHSKGKG